MTFPCPLEECAKDLSEALGEIIAWTEDPRDRLMGFCQEAESFRKATDKKWFISNPLKWYVAYVGYTAAYNYYIHENCDIDSDVCNGVFAWDRRVWIHADQIAWYAGFTRADLRKVGMRRDEEEKLSFF